MSPLRMFLSAFIIGFSGAITPGPLLLVTISQTLKIGLIATFMIVAGHGFLEVLVTVGLSLGLKGLMDKPIIFKIIGVVGGAVMIWMALEMFKNTVRPTNPDISDLVKTMRLKEGKIGTKIAKPFGLGVVVSLSNPFWTIWWLTVGAAFVTQVLRGGFILFPSFYFGHILSDLTWYGIVGVSITMGRRLISPEIYRAFLMICSLLLFLFGCYFIYTASKGGFSLI